MKSGNMHRARRLNKRSRLLQLYMSEVDPSPKMSRLVNYFIKVYVPCILSVRHHGFLEFGLRHLSKEIKAVQAHCTEEEKQVVNKNREING